MMATRSASPSLTSGLCLQVGMSAVLVSALLGACVWDNGSYERGACVVGDVPNQMEGFLLDAGGLPGEPQAEAELAGFLTAYAPCEVRTFCGWQVAHCLNPTACEETAGFFRTVGFFDEDVHIRGYARHSDGSPSCALPRRVQLHGELPPCWLEYPDCNDGWPDCGGP